MKGNLRDEKPDISTLKPVGNKKYNCIHSASRHSTLVK